MMNWTPIADGLPPVGIPLIVTVYDSLKFEKELRYPVYYQKGFYSNGYGFYLYGDNEHLLLPQYSEVLAWCELPKVYEGCKPRTNYDRIQNMSIEELGDFLSAVKYDGIYQHEGQEYPMQKAVWEDWLQAKVRDKFC